MPTPDESKPTPDPTILTTEQLLREITNLTALFDSKIRCVEELTTEKFASVTEQLSLVERQRVEQKQDTKTAVDAALQAQKEAVREQTAATDKAIAKTEGGTAEQLRQMATNFRTEISGVLTTLNDVKDRVVKIEAAKIGGTEVRQEDRASRAFMFTAIGFVVSMIMAAIIIIPIVLANQK